MATSSITSNIVISGSRTAEDFINELNEAYIKSLEDKNDCNENITDI